MLKSQKALENCLLKVLISAYRSDSMLKVISRLYRGLQEIKTVNTTYIKQKWDRETNSCLSEDTWIKYCEFQWRISWSNTWRSFGWKCLIGISLHLLSRAITQDLLAVGGCVVLRKPITTICDCTICSGPVQK